MEEVNTKQHAPANIASFNRIQDKILQKRENNYGKFQAQVSEERFKEFQVVFNDGIEGTIPYDMLMDSRCIRDKGILILRVYRRFLGLQGTCIHKIEMRLRRQELTKLEANAHDKLHKHFEQKEPTIKIISETRSEIQKWISDYPSVIEWMDI